MDTRVDFQRLLEDMDKALQAKRRELSELDERLEAARTELSEREAKELLSAGENTDRNEQDDRQEANKGAGRGAEDQSKLQRKIYEEQLEKFGDELAELESINQELVKENETLRRELIVSQRKCDQLEASARSLSDNLCEVQSANLELNLQLAKAESEMNTQQKLLQRSHQEDQVLMDAFSGKLEALKRDIEARDEEIRRLRADSKFVLDAFGQEIGQRDKTGNVRQRSRVREHEFSADLNNDNSGQSATGESERAREQEHQRFVIDFVQLANAVDGNLIDPDKKQRVIEILGAFREKEAQIVLLKDQLLQATRDLEQNATLLERLSSNNDQPASDLQHEQKVTTAAGSGECKCKMLESELEAKDKQLHLIELRLHHYERILPTSIGDLVQWLTRALVGGLQIGRQKRLRFQLDGGDKDRENLAAGCQPEFNERLIEKMEQLRSDLSRLLNELNLTTSLLNQLDQARIICQAKETHVCRLVSELNRLDAKYNFVRLDAHSLIGSADSKSESGRERESLSCFIAGSDSATVDHGQSDNKSLSGGNNNECRQFEKSQQPSGSDSTSAGAGERELEQQQRRQVTATKTSYERRSIKLDGTLTANADAETTSGPELVTKQTDAIGGSISSSNKLAGKEEAAAADFDDDGCDDNEERKEEPMAISGGSDGHQSACDESEERSIRRLASRCNDDDDHYGQMKGQALGVGSDKVVGGEPAERQLANYLIFGIQGEAESSGLTRRLEGVGTKTETATLHSRLQSRLRQLENENELLDLAMKEILLSLKWSDGQCSTILIDCPSLERLCQLIEARFIATSGSTQEPATDGEPPVGERAIRSKDLFQWIVLKSELDLLRGQNEQLRAEIKNQRRDHHEFMSRQNDKLTTNASGRLIEAGCQTEIDLAVGTAQKSSGDCDKQRPSRCANCDRLIKFSNHLFQCVVQVEARVSVCDESYMSRVTKLHQVVQMLERELTTSCRLLSESRRERSLAREQKLIIQTRLEMLENQFNVHLKTCPLSMIQIPVAAARNVLGHQQQQATTGGHHGHKVQVYTSARSTHGNSIQSLTIQSEGRQSLKTDHPQQQQQQQQTRGARMTISVLQSIINCLQARLDYKDERVRQLELLISSGGQDAQDLNQIHYPLIKPKNRLKIM